MADQGALGFMSSGTIPGTNQQASQTTTAMPSWWTDYTSQYLNKVAQYANTPTPLYGGPRVAGQDQLTKDASNNSSGLFSAAAAGTDAARNLIAQGANQNNPLGTAQPDMNAGKSLVGGSVAPGMSGLDKANPYLTSSANPTYNSVDKYMNPYNRNVTDAIAAAGQRNLTENTLPALQNSFTAAGNITGNSTTSADLAARAARDQGIATSQAQSGALQAGYGQSLGAAGADASRMAQLGATAGQLGTQAQTAQQNAGTDMINAGVAAGQLNSAGANTAIGAGQALQGVNTQGMNNSIGAIGTQAQMGQTNQEQVQKNLDQAHTDFIAQRDDQLRKAGLMQGALSGMPVPTSTTSYATGTGTPATVGNSPLVNVGNTLGGLYASTVPPG